MCAERKFNIIKQITLTKKRNREKAKSRPGGVQAKRRVGRIDGGLPMDINRIKFRVAGMVQRGGFV